MAEVSEFLRKKAAESSGMAEPSEFLRKKAAESAATTTQNRGENAYGGTKWLETQRSSSDEEIIKSAIEADIGRRQSRGVTWKGTTESRASNVATIGRGMPVQTEMEAEEEPVQVENTGSMAQEYARIAELAQQTYDAYIQSDEYRDKMRANMAAQAAAMQEASGIHSYTAAGQQTQVQEDQKEKELRAIRDYYRLLAQQAADQEAQDAGIAEKNKRIIEENTKLLASTQMDGQNHSVLEELNLLSSMENGDEKKQRKAAVLKKLDELGVGAKDYALYTDDANFTWGNFGRFLGNAAMSGLASFNKGMTATADLLLGAPLKAIGWENNPVSQIADHYSDIYDNYRYNTQMAQERLGGGGGWQFAGEAIEGTIGALPNALLALMTSGASLTTSSSTLATKAAYETGNVLSKAGITVEAMMKNPQYWLSFARTLGSDYEEAKQMGASDTAAAFGATLTSLLNAGVEIGTDGMSGIQGLPDELTEDGSKLLKWAVSSFEEGGEEGIQKFISEIVGKVVYGSDEKILDPIEYAKEMSLGTISGMTLSGAQIATQDTINAISRNISNRGSRKTQEQQPILDQEQEQRNLQEYQSTDTRHEAKEESVQQEQASAAKEEVQLNNSGTAMLDNYGIGIHNTPEQLAEANRLATEYGVDIRLYTDYSMEKESYVEDGKIFLNTESQTDFESLVRGYVNNQVQGEQEKSIRHVAELPDSSLYTGKETGATQETTEQVAGVAVQMQQDQNFNGGITNGSETTDTAAGTDLLHGSSQRYDGARAGEPAGGMAGSTGRAAQGKSAVDSRRTAAGRRNRIGSLRLPKISSAELGLKTGTEAKTVQLVPQEHWDAEMNQLADRIWQETGKQVSYVMGKIQIRGKSGRVINAKGVINGNQIIVQADHLRLSMEQIADHESYHAKREYFGQRLNQEVRQHIINTFSEEEFREVAEKYVEALRGVYDKGTMLSGEDFEQMMDYVQEEIFADAYAGINAFGSGADRFTSAVNEKMEQLYLGRYRSQENGVRETNGPPAPAQKNTADGGERYSTEDYTEYEKPITIADVEVLREIGKKSINDFSSEDLHKAKKWAYKYYQIFKTKSPFFRAWFGDWRSNDTSDVTTVKAKGISKLENGRETNADTGMVLSWNAHDFSRETVIHAARDKVALEAIDYLPEIIREAILLDTKVSMPTSKSKMQNTAFMHSFYTVYANNNGTYLLKLYAEEALNNKGTNSFTRAYQLKDIRKIAALGYGVLGENSPLSGANTATINTVAELFAAVKQYDPEFTPKDSSKVANGDGTPKVVYHGSAEQFTVFSYGHIGSSTGVGILGDGFYFTDKKRLAKNYGGNVYPVYLQMKKPYIATESDAYKLRTTDIQSQGYDGVILHAPRGDVFMVFENTQIKSATDNIGTFDGGNPDIRYSIDELDEEEYARQQARDNQGRQLSQGQAEYFKDSKARDENGNLMVLYHQTENVFTVFDTHREGAGKNDNATPFGIFLKSTDRDIGLKGKKQMPLYVNITNPLNARNREDLVHQLRELSPEYRQLHDEINGLDQEYRDRIERAKQELQDYMVKWRSENENASRTALYDDAKFMELFDAEDQIVDEWTEKADELDRKAKNVITDALIHAGFDGIILHQDQGSFGRSTDAYIALHQNQVKNVDNLNPTSSPDIRYSIDELDEKEFARQQARDDQGRQLSQGQAEYFNDSQARDENGNLATVYHSSPTAGFYQFDGRNGNGHYRFGKYGKTVTFFTDKKAMADTYTTDNKRVDTTRNGRFKDGLQDLKRKVTGQPAPSYSGQYEGYTNITKPYVVDAEGRNWDDVRTVFEQEKYDSLMSITPEEKAAVMSLWEMAGQNQDWFCAICNMFDIRASRAQLKDTSQRHGYKMIKNSETWKAIQEKISGSKSLIASAVRKAGDADALTFGVMNDFAADVIRDYYTKQQTTNDVVADALEDGEYDGVIIRNVVDYSNHSQPTELTPGNLYITFSPEQFKAWDNTEPTRSKDIRYSIDEMDDATAMERELEQLKSAAYQDELARSGGSAALARNQRRIEDLEWQIRRDPETYNRRKERELQTEGKVSAKAEVPSQQELERERQEWLQRDYDQKSKEKENKPTISKRELRSTMMSIFSIPDGQRAELGQVIDHYADRLIKNGVLTEADRRAFFDRMYDAGVMTVPADEYMAMGRSYIANGRIYVADSVRSEFGDDWESTRKRAFAAGVYLTRNREDPGIDVWNHDLSSPDMVPGLFNAEETDLRTILEQIISVAEEGKDEHMSLAEYTKLMADQDFISEDEFLDEMERKMDIALATFAEKAGLEVRLRNSADRRVKTAQRKVNERLAQQAYKDLQRRAGERAYRKEMNRKQQERKELRELQQKTLKQLQWLSKNRYRAPEELRSTWNEVLGDIDIYAIGAADEMNWSNKYNATWRDLVQMYKDAMTNDPNFMPSKELERIVARLDGSKIEDMDLGALQDLYKAAIGLRTEFYNRNNVINDEMQRLFEEVYADVKKEINAAPGGYTGNVVDKFLNMDQLTPMNVMQRMAGWDPNSTFYSMARQLERGERDMRAYSVKAKRMLQEFLTAHEDWAKKADGQGEDAVWYELEVPQLVELGMGNKPIFGPTVTVYMTPAQKVHMYLESKNPDNLRHMTGGRTFADKELYSKGKRQEALAQGRTIRMAPETVKAIVADLTEEEMELARLLEQYYNSFATKEINRVSNILYGYDKAMGKNYAPIYTNRNYTKAEFGVFDTTAEGVGNLKGRQYAVNPSYNISAFDAFERHVDQTARFVGMAIPARNWTTLMNWREENSSTGDLITHKWGEEGKKYISDLITTLQAGDDMKTETVSSMLGKLQSNYITAIFGANPSIVLKQLGSIPMASAYLGAKNRPSISQIRRLDKDLIAKYTQDLEWRTMGYSMPETKYLKENPTKLQSNQFCSFVFGGDAITAMDGWAASTLWPWAENKVHREHPELEVGTAEQVAAGESPFYKKVAEEFENAVARSQSTSDEIHQSRIRKSKNFVTKAFTMFRSDAAQSYNTIRQKIGEAQYLMRTGETGPELKKAKNAVGQAFMAVLINAAWGEAISLLMALWKNKGKHYRNDEDELTWQSVAGEMVTNMLSSFAGTVTFGEEIFELVGNILTGETFYDIETPGMEQLNNVINALKQAGNGMRKVIAGAVNVVANGGDLLHYLGKNANDMLGCVKNVAETACVYLGGVPVSNVEAYLLGALKWISPVLGTAYEDAFASVEKRDLGGISGKALAYRISGIMDSRDVDVKGETATVLGQLYEAGYKAAVPSDIPTSITVKGNFYELNEYQKQTYGMVWADAVAGNVDALVASKMFRKAEPKEQEKMLNYLYTYAGEMAKAELFENYEPDTRDETVAAFAEVGLDMVDFLIAYGKYNEIYNMEINNSQKADMFSHWVDGQGYTDAQAKTVRNELVYYNMMPAGAKKYNEMVENGVDPDTAYAVQQEMYKLDAEDAEDVEYWRLIVDMSSKEYMQVAMLGSRMNDATFKKLYRAYKLDVSPDMFVTYYETRNRFDADGNGTYTQTEIKAVIDAMGKGYTMEQKGVLWQMATGSTSTKNNPYSKEAGQRWLDAKAEEKE